MTELVSGLVSIIMPTFNSSNYLREAVESVLAQSYKTWELIIVDDGSKDDSVGIANAYALVDPRIKPIQMPVNGGPAAARNAAIQMARGQYIAFLDSDDIWLPAKLEIQIKAMRERHAVFCYASYQPFRGNEEGPAVHVPETISYQRMLKGSVIGCLTVVYDAAKLGKRYFSDGKAEIEGTWYAKYVSKLGHEDYVLWLQILKDCAISKFGSTPVVGVTSIQARYRLHDQSFSTNKKKVALYQWIIYRRCERLGLIRSLYSFAWYAFNGFIKHRKT